MDKIILKNKPGDSSSLFWDSFVQPILKYKKMIYTMVGLSVLVALVYCLRIPNQYTCTATILPSSKARQMPVLGSLAGSLTEIGLGSMVQVSEESSALYPKILTSRLLQERILQREYLIMDKAKQISITLNEYIGAKNIDLALLELSGMVDIRVDRNTGLTTLLVTTKYPELSAEVAHAYLEELDNYNVNHRRSEAANSERFIATRLAEIKMELQETEDRLCTFLEQNLNYATSTDPSLRRQLARLERGIAIKETVFSSLTEKHELAKLEAAKDIPILQVLDRGSVPVIKSSPGRRNFVIGAFFGSLFISIMLSLWFDLSVKRHFRDNLEKVARSPAICVNRLEAGLIRRIGDFAALIERPRGVGKRAAVDNDSK